MILAGLHRRGLGGADFVGLCWLPERGCWVDVPVGMAPLIFVGMVLRMDGFHSVFRIGEEHLPNVDMRFQRSSDT